MWAAASESKALLGLGFLKAHVSSLSVCRPCSLAFLLLCVHLSYLPSSVLLCLNVIHIMTYTFQCVDNGFLCYTSHMHPALFMSSESSMFIIIPSTLQYHNMMTVTVPKIFGPFLLPSIKRLWKLVVLASQLEPKQGQKHVYKLCKSFRAGKCVECELHCGSLKACNVSYQHTVLPKNPDR